MDIFLQVTRTLPERDGQQRLTVRFKSLCFVVAAVVFVVFVKKWQGPCKIY